MNICLINSFARLSFKKVRMTDVNTIRLTHFCGKGDKWPIWSENFLAKAKRYGFKDFLGKLSITKV
jgi:hypothetical protein